MSLREFTQEEQANKFKKSMGAAAGVEPAAVTIERVQAVEGELDAPRRVVFRGGVSRSGGVGVGVGGLLETGGRETDRRVSASSIRYSVYLLY
jgi:hypothetical protein